MADDKLIDPRYFSDLGQLIVEKQLGGFSRSSTYRFSVPAGSIVQVSILVPPEEVWRLQREIRDVYPGVIYETCVKDGKTIMPRQLLWTTNQVTYYPVDYLILTDLVGDFENSHATQDYIVEITLQYVIYRAYEVMEACRALQIPELR